MHVLQQADHLITATHSVISMIRSAVIGLDDCDRAGRVVHDVVADASQEHPEARYKKISTGMRKITCSLRTFWKQLGATS